MPPKPQGTAVEFNDEQWQDGFMRVRVFRNLANDDVTYPQDFSVEQAIDFLIEDSRLHDGSLDPLFVAMVENLLYKGQTVVKRVTLLSPRIFQVVFDVDEVKEHTKLHPVYVNLKLFVLRVVKYVDLNGWPTGNPFVTA